MSPVQGTVGQCDPTMVWHLLMHRTVWVPCRIAPPCATSATAGFATEMHDEQSKRELHSLNVGESARRDQGLRQQRVFSPTLCSPTYNLWGLDQCGLVMTPHCHRSHWGQHPHFTVNVCRSHWSQHPDLLRQGLGAPHHWKQVSAWRSCQGLLDKGSVDHVSSRPQDLTLSSILLT